MKIYEVEFEGIWPVGTCLIIVAKSQKEAEKIAAETVTHTDVISVKLVNTKKSGVIVYLNGDY